MAKGILPVDAEYRWDLDDDGLFDEVTGPYARIDYAKSNPNAIRLGVFVKKERADSAYVEGRPLEYPLLAVAKLDLKGTPFYLNGRVDNLKGSGLRLLLEVESPTKGWVSQSQEVSSDGTFEFALGLKDREFKLTVMSQPTKPNQICAVAEGSASGNTGTTGDLEVQCVTTRYAVNGTVTGLASGNSLTLEAVDAVAETVVFDNDVVTYPGSDNDIPFQLQIPDGGEFKITAGGAVDQTCYTYGLRGVIDGRDYEKAISVVCGPAGYVLSGGAIRTEPSPPFDNDEFPRRACGTLSLFGFADNDSAPLWYSDVPRDGGEFASTRLREGTRYRIHYQSPGFQCSNGNDVDVDEVDLANPWQGAALLEGIMGTEPVDFVFDCKPKAIALQGAVRGLADGNTLTGTLYTWVDPDKRTETPWTVGADTESMVLISDAECGMSYELSVDLDESAEIPGAAVRQTCSVTENAVGVFEADQPSPDPVVSCQTMDDDGDGIDNAVDDFPNAVTSARYGSAALELAPDVLFSECSVVTFTEQAFESPSGYVGIDQALGFSLHGCSTDTPERVEVELDFGIPLPPGGLAYKVDGDSFRLIPGATVSGSRVRYTIVDNGDLDQNSTAGEIEDPVTVLVPLKTEIPTLGEWALGLLAALMTLVGGVALRRRFV